MSNAILELTAPQSKNTDAGDFDRKAMEDAVIGAIRTVQDPEIPLNIYDLGLIYRIDVSDQGVVGVDMTLTAPGCPVAGEMVGWVEQAIVQIEGVDTAIVNLVFDPPWEQSMMSEAAQLQLGLI